MTKIFFFITGEYTMLLLFDTKIDCSIIMSKVDEKWTIYINKPKCKNYSNENCIKFWQRRKPTKENFSNKQIIKTN